MEDYIEMIYRLSLKEGYTRVNDLAQKLNVQPPSVTRMMQKLHENNLLIYERYGMIHLTEKGKKMGEFFLKRHNILKEFLYLLEIDNDLQKEVEQVEHYISWNTCQTIAALVEFLKERKDILIDFKAFKKKACP
ncbi:MAG: transcriptional regulator MntR [Candidatus Syntrophonatronum acetioxidans]|uniref:Manganese transport regulator n=1 Tax=Candidatus Syntrophonatronum acetioxidans TaxID=1795816 RepID=A0A424YHC7_9FIRM|nr:MAG: transcriptional regulator MntR [Candidatus Syntrophonatronum acetioxidans]